MAGDLLKLPGMTQPEPEATGRDAAGRFGPGNSGRPRGVRTLARIMGEKVMARDAAAIMETVTRAALDGDLVASRLVIERMYPVRRGACVEIPDMPDPSTPAGRSAALARVLEAVASGEVSAEEGASIASIVEAVRKHHETEVLADRLAAIEERLGK